MTDFPSSTVFGRRIPKRKFYENISVTPALKRVFVEQVNQILWRNKIAPGTVNIAPGVTVAEIEVIALRLNQPKLDQKLLGLIDREIPYHLLFLLEYDGKVQAWIAYKEEAKTGAFKPGRYYHTGWLPPEDLTLRLEGLNMDAVYENLIRQIAGEALGRDDETNDCDIREAVSRDERRRKLQREIDVLQGKVQREKQFNRQVELNAELKRMTKEFESLR
jgi:hypothetical protein